jgi:leucyl-tRNA synthetase
MKMLNTLEPIKLNEGKDSVQAIRPAVLRECIGILLRMLYPVVPHLTHRLWIEMGYRNQGGLILDAPWPIVDEAALVKTEIDLVLQVNGKLRGEIDVAVDAPREVIEGVALVRALRKWLERNAAGKPCDRVIVLRTPKVELTPGQAAMAKGHEKIWREVEPQLRKRGVEIVEGDQHGN